MILSIISNSIKNQDSRSLLLIVFFITCYIGFIMIGGKLAAISALSDLKKYTFSGEILKTINKNIYEKDNLNHITAYLVAQTKEHFIIRPEDYCAIQINKKDITFMALVPNQTCLEPGWLEKIKILFGEIRKKVGKIREKGIFVFMKVKKFINKVFRLNAGK